MPNGTKVSNLWFTGVIYLLFVLVGLVAEATSAQEAGSNKKTPKTISALTLINPIEIERRDELIIVPLSKLQGIDPAAFVVRLSGRILPGQAEDMDFDGEADAIAFLVDMGPKQELKVSIENAPAEPLTSLQRAHAEISVAATLPEAKGPGVKVFDGRFISKKELLRNPANRSSAYRFEGPLIESDKVGYRLYWDKRGAIDVFGKVSDMSVGDHHRGAHHTMQPWGRDLLHNGPALGVGGLGIGSDTNRFSPSGAPYAKIVIGSNGPIRSSYRMIYKNIEYQGHKYDLTWDIAMSAGKRYLTHTINVTRGDELLMLAALTNHLDEGGVTEKRSLNQSGQLDWVGTYGKQVFRDEKPELAKISKEQMGLGLLWLHSQLQKFNTNDLEFQAAFKPTKQLTYYSLVAYNQEKASPIENDGDFYAYMQKLANCLANPVGRAMPAIRN